jgi:hypothetical protein
VTVLKVFLCKELALLVVVIPVHTNVQENFVPCDFINTRDASPLLVVR